MSAFSISFLFSMSKTSSLHTKSNQTSGKKKQSPTLSAEAEIAKSTFNVSLLGDGIGTLELDSPLGGLQISYNICEVKYDINILCWSQAAKVSEGDKVSFIKTIQRDQHIFCTFSIRHIFKLLHEDLQNLFDYGIVFNVTRTISSKIDGPQSLYYFIQDLQQNPDFCPLYLDPPQINVLSEEVVSELIWKRFTTAVPDPIFDLDIDVPHVTDIYCQSEVTETIEKIVKSNFKPPIVESWPLMDRMSHLTRSVSQTKNGKSAKRKSSKSQKSSVKLPTKGYSVDIAGQKIFSATRKLIEAVCPVRTSELEHFSVLLKTGGLIDHHQIGSFNPLMILIEKINNLPLYQLEEKGFTHIYTTWDWMGQSHCSYVFPLDSTIHLDDLFTIILSDELSADVIAELYSHKLHVKAIMKLDLLLKTPKVINISKSHSLPSRQELESLRLEFCVPVCGVKYVEEAGETAMKYYGVHV